MCLLFCISIPGGGGITRRLFRVISEFWGEGLLLSTLRYVPPSFYLAPIFVCIVCMSPCLAEVDGARKRCACAGRKRGSCVFVFFGGEVSGCMGMGGPPSMNLPRLSPAVSSVVHAVAKGVVRGESLRIIGAITAPLALRSKQRASVEGTYLHLIKIPNTAVVNMVVVYCTPFSVSSQLVSCLGCGS